MSPSSWTLFIQSIIGKSFSKEKITALFNEKVSKEDFSRNDKVDLIKHAFSLQK